MSYGRWMTRGRLIGAVRTLLRQATSTAPPTPVEHAGTGGTGGTGGTDGTVEYSPELDGEPDPGEVVWTWVSYEDDPSRGKDRPVLLVGRSGASLLALQLSSKDHDRDAEDEARYGRFWMDIGSGGWDSSRRPSEVRLDRLILVEESAVRREGAILDRGVFESVIDEARRYHDL